MLLNRKTAPACAARCMGPAAAGIPVTAEMPSLPERSRKPRPGPRYHLCAPKRATSYGSRRPRDPRPGTAAAIGDWIRPAISIQADNSI